MPLERLLTVACKSPECRIDLLANADFGKLDLQPGGASSYLCVSHSGIGKSQQNEQAERRVRIRQLVENLCRADLTALERAEDLTELVDIVRETRGGQVAQPGGRQPHDRGISWASRTLGFTREEVRRSTKIAGISPKAKAKAKEFRLDNNQTALLEIATEDAADGQLAKIEEIGIRNIATRARLRNRRGASKAHKKCKAHTRRSTPKSSASDYTAETATPPAADSPAMVPETFSGGETAAEIEQLKAELAKKTESLRQIEGRRAGRRTF